MVTIFKIAGSVPVPPQPGPFSLPFIYFGCICEKLLSEACKLVPSKLLDDQLTRRCCTVGYGPSGHISSKFMVKLFIWVLLFNLNHDSFKWLLFDDLEGMRGDLAFFFGCIEIKVLTLFRVRSFSFIIELFNEFSCVLLCNGGSSSLGTFSLLCLKILLLLL
jgi:hypothetical protein